MQLVTIRREAGATDGQPLFVHFVNTLHWYEGVPIELIGTDVDLAAWLAEQNLGLSDLSGGLPAVHALREHVRGLTEAVARGRSPGEADLAALNAALGTPVGHLVLSDGETPRPRLAFGAAAADGVLFAFRVGLSLATFLESGDRHRLKLCANPECGFAFVDTSINRTRRWCDMRYCGNRLKARAFRGRNRQRLLRPLEADNI
jgi:predicted RNA-binding Zn ribbon-like protein